MALKTTIAAALAAITLSLFAGAPAEAKTKVYLGVGGAGWGVHSCWDWPRRCGYHPRARAYPRPLYYAPSRPVVIYKDYGRNRVSCTTARRIVDRNGFNSVRTNECRGDTFTFNGWRNGKLYRVYVNARNGRIIDTRRI